MGSPYSGYADGINSVSPSSPIIEMPPSPAPSNLMYVEFPDEDVDDIKVIGVQNIVEVRFDTILFALILTFFIIIC